LISSISVLLAHAPPCFTAWAPRAMSESSMCRYLPWRTVHTTVNG
jgi:hypothetical protein